MATVAQSLVAGCPGGNTATGASPAAAESGVREMILPVVTIPLISQKKLTSYNVQGPLFVIVNNDAWGSSAKDELCMAS
jgi:hypothetical protein